MPQKLFKKQSLMTRIAIGKLLGFAVGLLGFLLIPVLVPYATLMFRSGILFWYTAFGAIIGVFGVFVWHPVLKISIPWWFRSMFIGAWLNLTVTLMSYDQLNEIVVAAVGTGSIFSSPFWFVLEGAIIALFIDYFATKYGGQGADIVDKS